MTPDKAYIYKVTEAVNVLTDKDSLFSDEAKEAILAEFNRAVVPVGMKVMNEKDDGEIEYGKALRDHAEKKEGAA